MRRYHRALDMDIDTTIKTAFGKQEGAVIGYNPKKPGRPSHTQYTYMVGSIETNIKMPKF